jgi:hypothetical protein
MRTPLSLLALLLLSVVRAGAQTKAPIPDAAGKPVEEPHFYYHSPRVNSWGDVVSRRSISLTSDLGKLDELCMIPPAADWIAAGASEEAQQKYLQLIWRSAWSMANAQGKGNLGGRTIGLCGVNAYAVLSTLGDFNNFFVLGGNDDAVKARTGFAGCLSTKDPVKGEPKYASFGKTVVAPAKPIIETLNLLLKSTHPQTVLETLGDIRMIANTDKFRDSIEALVKDKSVTATVTINPPDEGKETLPLRVYAMRTLATIERTERSAQVLALIWHDETEKPEIREGAIRAFSFIVEWPGPVLSSAETRPAMYKALYPFLAPLMMINGVENDKKDDAGPKSKLSPLGEAAYCAAERFPKALRDKARKGEKF